MSDEAQASGFIRPYVITGGRTEVNNTNLNLDTLVSALPGRSAPHRDFEHRAVLQRCVEPLSIAEIATSLDLPVGVVTVVIDDLLEDNVLLLHRSSPSVVPVSVLERLLQGVRAL